MDLTVAVVIVVWGLYFWWEHREEERIRTQSERSRRNMRDLEHALLVELGYEDLLRRMLIEDLKQIAARRRAIAWAKEHYGIEIQWPLASSSAKTGRFTRGRSS